MKCQYESEILYKLMERDGFNIPSSVPPYEAEIKAYLINQVKQAYPKLTDYEAEWLLYNYTKHLPADFPISSVSDVMEARFENVVPFAYQSAILKGNTLVNLVTTDTSNGYTLINDGTGIKGNRLDLIDGFDNKNYTFVLEFSDVNIVNENPEWGVYITVLSLEDNGADNLTINSHVKNGKVTFLYRPSRQRKTINNFSISLHPDSGVGSTITITNVVVLDGDYTNVDIPYFTGMQSVKMPVLKTVGKNLFNLNDVTPQSKIGIFNTSLIDDGIKVDIITNSLWEEFALGGFIPVKQNTNYKQYYENTGVLSGFENFDPIIIEFDKDKNEINRIYGGKTNQTFTTKQTTCFIKLDFRFRDTTPTGIGYVKCIQLEEATESTPYEPFKSNILTVNEEVELRGIGDVQDELNCLTGEVTSKIEEVLIDCNGYGIDGLKELNNLVRFYIFGIDIGVEISDTAQFNTISDNFISSPKAFDGSSDFECVYVGYNAIYFKLNKNRLSEITQNGVANWFKSNPTTVCWVAEHESIKTVDLTTVNEKAESVYFMPLEGTMNVQSSGEIIQPTFDMSVPVEATTQNLASFIELEME